MEDTFTEMKRKHTIKIKEIYNGQIRLNKNIMICSLKSENFNHVEPKYNILSSKVRKICNIAYDFGLEFLFFWERSTSSK